MRLSDDGIPILFVAGVLVIGLPLLIYAGRWAKKKQANRHAQFEDLAKRLNGVLEWETVNPVIRFKQNSREHTFCWRTRDIGRRYKTHSMCLELTYFTGRDTSDTFYLFEKTALSSIELGLPHLKNIPVSGGFFDSLFVIQGNDEEKVGRFLNEPVRKAIVDFHRDGQAKITIKLDQGRLTVRRFFEHPPFEEVDRFLHDATSFVDVCAGSL